MRINRKVLEHSHPYTTRALNARLLPLDDELKDYAKHFIQYCGYHKTKILFTITSVSIIYDFIPLFGGIPLKFRNPCRIKLGNNTQRL